METIIFLGFMLLAILPILLPILALLIASYILEGIAFTRLQKSKPVKYLWLVWVPYLDIIGKMHIMAHLSKETEIRMLCGRLIFKRKITPWKIYIFAYAFSTLISGLGLATVWIPFIGTVSLGLDSLVLILASIWLNLVEYAYLRDLLNAYFPGHPSNVSNAVVVTIGNMFTFGLFRAIFLFKLAKKQMNKATVEENTVDETELGAQTETELETEILETETEQETEILETAE